MKDKRLPAFCYPGRDLFVIGGVIIHYFSAINVERDKAFDMTACRNLFIDLNLPREKRKVYDSKYWPDKRMHASAHLLIGRDGEAWKLVPFNKEAYHAGASVLKNRRYCNKFTLGIELVGTATSGFEDIQYEVLANFLAPVMDNNNLQHDDIAGHDLVRWEAINHGMSKKEKRDPSGKPDGSGDNFDWEKLRGKIDAIRNGTVGEAYRA